MCVLVRGGSVNHRAHQHGFGDERHIVLFLHTFANGVGELDDVGARGSPTVRDAERMQVGQCRRGVVADTVALVETGVVDEPGGGKLDAGGAVRQRGRVLRRIVRQTIGFMKKLPQLWRFTSSFWPVTAIICSSTTSAGVSCVLMNRCCASIARSIWSSRLHACMTGRR